MCLCIGGESTLLPLHCRRECSLDVEVSASGYTKDMQEDDTLLHPAGPEDQEGLDGEDEEPTVADGPLGGSAPETVDLEEFRNAILELEGLKIGEDVPPGEAMYQVWVPQPDEHSQATETAEAGRTPTEPDCKAYQEPGRDDKEEEEGGAEGEEQEAADECPELVDLSSANKEFKPFRWRSDFFIFCIS